MVHLSLQEACAEIQMDFIYFNSNLYVWIMLTVLIVDLRWCPEHHFVAGVASARLCTGSL
jgi:hypothetical protein